MDWGEGVGMKVIVLNKSNQDEILNLLNHCNDYFELVEGEKPSINNVNEILEDFPPEKDISDKKVLGLFDNQELIGLVDFIKGYKKLDEGIIGLFLIDERKRKLGIGKQFHETIVQKAKNYGIKRLRIGVAEVNINALLFWKKLGYEEIERKTMMIGKKENIIIVMNYVF